MQLLENNFSNNKYYKKSDDKAQQYETAQYFKKQWVPEGI